MKQGALWLTLPEWGRIVTACCRRRNGGRGQQAIRPLQRIMRAMQPLIRPAAPADQRAIRAWVWRAGLNPINLSWRNFVVAEVEGQIVGLGQLRPHADGSLELASLVVSPAHRGRGIGSQIVRALLASRRGPIYLFCENALQPYYTRLGFQPLQPADLPPALARMHRMARWLMRLASAVSRREMGIVAMRWERGCSMHGTPTGCGTTTG